MRDRKIMERIEFESPDLKFTGQITMTTTLSDDNPVGTHVTILCEDIPPGIRLEDNELGCTLALRNLAKLLEP